MACDVSPVAMFLNVVLARVEVIVKVFWPTKIILCTISGLILSEFTLFEINFIIMIIIIYMFCLKVKLKLIIGIDLPFVCNKSVSIPKLILENHIDIKDPAHPGTGSALEMGLLVYCPMYT